MKNRTERDIYAGKGGSLIVIVSCEAVIQTAQRQCREERSYKLCVRSHRVKPEGMVQVKVSKEEEAAESGRSDHRRRPGYLERDIARNGIRTTKGKTNRKRAYLGCEKDKCAGDGGVHQNAIIPPWL